MLVDNEGICAGGGIHSGGVRGSSREGTYHGG